MSGMKCLRIGIGRCASWRVRCFVSRMCLIRNGVVFASGDFRRFMAKNYPNTDLPSKFIDFSYFIHLTSLEQ